MSTRSATFLAVGALVVTVAVVVAMMTRGTTDPDEELRQALAALERGEFKVANDTLRRLLARPDCGARVRLLQGAIQLHSGRGQSALATLSSEPFEGDLRAPALALICESLYGLGELAAAEVAARQLIAEEPENSNAHRWLAAIYYDLGANQAAIAELEIVTSLAPEDYSPRHLLGVIHLDFEQYADAARELKKAVALNPPPEVRDAVVRDLVKSLVRTREFETALEYAGTYTDDPVLLALAAECHWGLGREDEARELLRRAATLDPDERTALLLRARLEMESGDPQSAIIPLKKQLDVDPHDYECRYRLSQVYRRLNRIAECDAQLEQLEFSRKLRTELSDLSEQAVEEPRNAAVRERIAVLYDHLNKPQLAESFRQAARSCRQISNSDGETSAP